MVANLQVENRHSICSLVSSWGPARGVADSYNLQLLDEKGVLVANASQAASATEHHFERLTPGKKYRVRVQTLSGGVLSEAAEAEGQTRNAHFFTAVFEGRLTGGPTQPDPHLPTCPRSRCGQRAEHQGQRHEQPGLQLAPP